MSQFLEHPELFDRIILLSEEDKKMPMGVIRRFFGDYHLHECRHILWTMLETCISVDHANFSEAEDRADLLTRTRHIEELMEASYLLSIADEPRSKVRHHASGPAAGEITSEAEKPGSGTKRQGQEKIENPPVTTNPGRAGVNAYQKKIGRLSKDEDKGEGEKGTVGKTGETGTEGAGAEPQA